MFNVGGPEKGRWTHMHKTRWQGYAILLMGLALAACGSTRATYVPDGRRGYVINCGGLLSSWSACLVKAGRACRSSGYDTIRGTEEDRSVLIACKLPGAAPSVAAAR